MEKTICIDGIEYRLVPVKKKVERKTEAMFTLTMPKVNTWNGRWSGDDKLFCRTIKAFRYGKPLYPNLKEGGYMYDFGDGWSAKVRVEFMTPTDAREMMKKSKGFLGYDWMCNSICKHGEIKYEDQ